MKIKTIFFPAIAILFIASCGDGNLNERMGRISGGIKKADSIAENIARGTSKLAKKLESYVDTTQYQKDTTGMWKKKSE